MKRLYGGIEAGGTKFMCMVGTGPTDIVAERRFPTTTPDETIRNAVSFFAPYRANGELAAIGIASFGPVDLNPKSSTWGYITTTPKPHWSEVDLCGPVQRALGLPTAFDTDVNAAAFGEHFWLPDKASLDPFLYVTVGTGVGVGIVMHGAPLHGLLHPEAGHFIMPHDKNLDPFVGVCPYHSDCLEGLASGPSMRTRWHQNPEDLPTGHPGWELEAEYLAVALTNLTYAYSPSRIILGGGVSQHPGLHDAVREKVRGLLRGYVRSPMLDECINEYIQAPALAHRSGCLGAIALAIRLMQAS